MIRVGLVGIGNISSMLVQSIEYYRSRGVEDGLIHYEIGGYRVYDIRFVYAIDVSENKVGKPLSEAIFSPPNTVKRIVRKVGTNAIVRMGRILDGIAPHMMNVFKPARIKEPSENTLVEELLSNEVDVLVNLLPVGSHNATRFYANVAAKAGVAFINGIPEFIASSSFYNKLFKTRKALLLGDDIKGQLGATIIHRALAETIAMRGAHLINTYQLNIGGNTDFLNMIDAERLSSKKISKTEAIACTQGDPERFIKKVHAGPSGYIEFLGNTKVAYAYLEAIAYAHLPVYIDLKLVVNDKAMATAVLVDTVRLAKALMEKRVYGAPAWASAPFFKHPPSYCRSDREAMVNLYRKLDRLGITITPKRVRVE